MRLAQRLLLGTALLVSVLVLVLVTLLDSRLRSRLVEDQTRDLEREARLVAAAWRPGMNADSLADAASTAVRHRVTIVDDTGRVVGDSDFDPPALARLENHGSRPEIVSARRDGSGSALRLSRSVGAEELYVAVRAPGGAVRLAVLTHDIDETFERTRRDVIATGVLALLGSLLLAWLFSRAISRPVVELRDTARAIAAGDLSRRPALSAPGEIGDLADALYRMAEQLGVRLTALQKDETLLSALLASLNEGVVVIDARRQVVRINESGRALLRAGEPVPFPADHLPRDRMLREALGRALAGAATDGAETTVLDRTLLFTARPLADGGAIVACYDLTPVRRLETVRRDFVANVSHELRTPLTVVGGYAETLEHDDPPPEMRRQFVSSILAHTRRMQRIVDDLLDLSRIESGGWVPAPVWVDVADVAAEAMAACRPSADEKGLALMVAPADGARRVWADPTALRQVLSNLVSNAVRHTAAGHVTVFSQPERGGVWIGVRDTGGGIPAEHLGRIFERFYRVDAGRSREAGGTGLGLAIVRHLVEAHRGRVTAESTVGSGTTIRCWFPSPAEPAPL